MSKYFFHQLFLLFLCKKYIKVKLSYLLIFSVYKFNMNNVWPQDINFLSRNSRKLILTALQILVSPHCTYYVWSFKENPFRRFLNFFQNYFFLWTMGFNSDFLLIYKLKNVGAWYSYIGLSWKSLALWNEFCDGGKLNNSNIYGIQWLHCVKTWIERSFVSRKILFELLQN